MQFPLEILDCVMGHLDDSLSDLVQSTLVCRDWYLTARRYILRSVDFSKPQMGKLHEYYEKTVNFFKEHPDYIPMVHELVFQWTPTLAAELLLEDIKFSEVRSIVFKNISWPAKDVIEPFECLLEQDSVQRITFVDVSFQKHQWSTLTKLLKQSPNIKYLEFIRLNAYTGGSRKREIMIDKPTLQGLSITRGSPHQIFNWIVDTDSCVFDLSSLKYFKYDLAEVQGLEDLSKFLLIVGSSLQTLEIHIPTIEIHNVGGIDISTATLPALKHLTFRHASVSSIDTIIQLLNSRQDTKSVMSTIQLDVNMYNDYDTTSDKYGWKTIVPELDEALSYQLQAPLLKTVDIRLLRRMKYGCAVSDKLVRFWQELLPRVYEKGVLHMSLEESRRWV
ncbi:hypothetical protein BDQ17DRAFT_1422733 [Cyathus striatus]|nr:hypothetical protein BDQ17DRAFT_1422733 [Cyathus striatus]